MHLTASAARPRGGIAGQRQSLAAKHGLTPTGGRPGAVASPQRRARASSWPARRRASAPNPRRRSARARPSRRCGSPGSARASLRRIPAIVKLGPAELAKADLLAEIPDERILAWLKANGPSPAVTAALLEAWKPKQLVKVPVADWDTLLQTGGRLSDFTLVLLFLAATDPGSQLGPKRAVAAYRELYGRLRSEALGKKALKRLARNSEEHLSPAEQAAARLAASFLKARWAVKDLLEIAEPDAFRDVLGSEGSSTLVQKLIPTLDQAQVSSAQREAVWDALIDSDISTVRKGLVALRKYVPW